MLVLGGKNQACETINKKIFTVGGIQSLTHSENVGTLNNQLHIRLI